MRVMRRKIAAVLMMLVISGCGANPKPVGPDGQPRPIEGQVAVYGVRLVESLKEIDATVRALHLPPATELPIQKVLLEANTKAELLADVLDNVVAGRDTIEHAKDLAQEIGVILGGRLQPIVTSDSVIGKITASLKLVSDLITDLEHLIAGRRASWFQHQLLPSAA